MALPLNFSGMVDCLAVMQDVRSIPAAGQIFAVGTMRYL